MASCRWLTNQNSCNIKGSNELSNGSCVSSPQIFRHRYFSTPESTKTGLIFHKKCNHLRAAGRCPELKWMKAVRFDVESVQSNGESKSLVCKRRSIWFEIM